jgi:hypothetical protein
MSAQPDEPYEKIHLGGQEAAVVPIEELRELRAIARHAPADVIAAARAEEAEIAEILAQHREDVAAGRPTRSHDDVMEELLAPSGGWTPPCRG